MTYQQLTKSAAPEGGWINPPMPPDDDFINRILAREGGKAGAKATNRDSGGFTRGGRAETSGMTEAQLKALTDQQVRQLWKKDLQLTAGIKDPGIREIAFDMRANMNPATATRYFQETTHGLLPSVGPPSADGVMGSQTVSQMNSVPQDLLAQRLMGRYQQHHEELAARPPKIRPGKPPLTYAPYAGGWSNRRTALWNSPTVVPFHPITDQPDAPARPPAPTTPKPIQRTTQVQTPDGLLVKAAPPPGVPIIPSTPPLAKQQSVLELMKISSFAADLRKARNATHTHPTPAQAQAGNYRHGTVKVRGFTVKLENPQGSTRCGKDKGGKAWSRVMANDYGYFTGIKAVDGDPLDVFIGPDPENGRIFVVDQHVDGKYDESKVLLGYPDEKAARKSYLAHYPPDWKGLKHITEMTDEKFREWTTGGQDTLAKGAADETPKHVSGKPSALDLLLEAKAHSDAGRMTSKQAILRKIIGERPQDFEVDQPDARHPGLTHKPSGFRIHAPRTVAALVPQKEASIFGLMKISMPIPPTQGPWISPPPAPPKSTGRTSFKDLLGSLYPAKPPEYPPLLENPGIPKAPGAQPPVFPGGKPAFPRTVLKAPPSHKIVAPGAGPLERIVGGQPAVRPSEMANQFLTRMPGGPQAFVQKQRQKFETDFPSTAPGDELINFKKREELVPVSSYSPSDAPGFMSGSADPKIVGINMKDVRAGRSGNPLELAAGTQAYHGLGAKGGIRPNAPQTLAHEAGHSYLNSQMFTDDITRMRSNVAKVQANPAAPTSSAYVMDSNPEYAQGATSGLNAMRDISGQELNTPQQVHQLFDEIETNPQLLDKIHSENARVFRSYLNLKQTNPAAAQRLRDSMARDSQYLVNNEQAATTKAATALSFLLR